MPPKLPRVSAEEAIHSLERLGFVQIRQRGSHNPIFGPLLSYDSGGIIQRLVRNMHTPTPMMLSVTEVASGLRSLRAATLLIGARGQQAYEKENKKCVSA